jgi:hypothetical protein
LQWGDRIINWDAVGAVGEILGATAVFISLLYLAVQIRGSNKLARIESRERANEALSRWRGKLLQDPRLDDIFHRGCNELDSLDDAEFRTFDNLFHELIMNMRVQYMRAWDLKHPEEMERLEIIAGYWGNQPGIAARWKVLRTPIEKPCLEMMERTLGPRDHS